MSSFFVPRSATSILDCDLPQTPPGHERAGYRSGHLPSARTRSFRSSRPVLSRSYETRRSRSRRQKKQLTFLHPTQLRIFQDNFFPTATARGPRPPAVASSVVGRGGWKTTKTITHAPSCAALLRATSLFRRQAKYRIEEERCCYTYIAAAGRGA